MYDRFHIMQHMTKAVDQVRKAENRKLLLEGDERRKKTRYLWLTTEKNLSEKQEAAFEALKNSDLRTARAWGINENLRNPWSYTSPGWAKRFFGQWYQWAVRSRLEPVKKVAAMIQRRLENLITYCTHFIKSKIFERVAIIFHAGVDPDTVQKKQSQAFRGGILHEIVGYYGP